ncbi:MAG: PHP domain-containing protein [Clostridiales bacterium]|nr:PHP domain-containing protein [Clostridiales bacterium]
MEELIAQLNAPSQAERLEALRALRMLADGGRLSIPEPDGNVNNHIHTTFSFSPYSPAKAVYTACMSKLSAVGIIDHDSASGIPEFREAGRIMGVPTTAGFEFRAGFEATPFEGARLNNPDQAGIAYMVVHGLYDAKLTEAENILKPIGEARRRRNARMCEKLSGITGIELDYESDVVPLSEKAHGGAVTERHILCALSLKLISEHGRGQGLRDRLAAWPEIGGKSIEKLGDPDEVMFLYDLIGVLKAGFVELFYIPSGDDECPNVREFIKFAKDTDSILAYAYLGDIENSVTGDKKAQKFEDARLDELFEVLHGLGIGAVTYMPARNTREQLIRVRNLCERHAMLQISGEDINSPRQPFISEASKDPFFANLKETTKMLIARES